MSEVDGEFESSFDLQAAGAWQMAGPRDRHYDDDDKHHDRNRRRDEDTDGGSSWPGNRERNTTLDGDPNENPGKDRKLPD